MQLFASERDLSGAFDQAAGYHGTCWIDLTGDALEIDREVPKPLRGFLLEVERIVRENNLADCRIGVAYVRLIDGSKPENFMRWHVDNQDGGTRFSTALSTDGVPVNLAWPHDASLVDQKVVDTAGASYRQPANGEIVVFTTEPHGVLPLQPRPGERTAVFFTTLYADRETADLYTTNCSPDQALGRRHAALPELETTR